MRVSVKRFKDGEFEVHSFELESKGNPTILEILTEIKERHDPTLSFRAMCRSSICGTCGVRVNGRSVLACTERVTGDEILIEPLEGFEPIRDLVVSHEEIFSSLRRAGVWRGSKESPAPPFGSLQAQNCILCGICNSVCPPILEGKNFGGPLLFTKFYAVRGEEASGGLGLEGIKEENIKGCVHCSNCNLSCPKGCMPERWITILEASMVRMGYIQKEAQDFGFLSM